MGRAKNFLVGLVRRDRDWPPCVTGGFKCPYQILVRVSQGTTRTPYLGCRLYGQYLLDCPLAGAGRLTTWILKLLLKMRLGKLFPNKVKKDG